MRILFTGAGGFIGSHCLEYFLTHTDWKLVIIDSFRHKGTYSRLNDISNFNPDRITIYNHDLSVPIDEQLENKILNKNMFGRVHEPIDTIINIASDSAVERSITDPAACWRNNCELILNMLELSRRIKPRQFFHLSTDEVYGQAEPDQAHVEWDAIVPSNPYSASKAAQEALAISYWRTYDVPLVLLNMMNAIGEMQDKEKFLPKLIWKIATDQTMEIYGEPGDIGSRFYIHAKNIASAIIYLGALKDPAMYEDGVKRPDRYNVVGDIEMNNLEVAQLVAKIMGKELKYKFIPSEKARRGYDKRYALDGDKMASLGWKHAIPTAQAIEQIVKWTMDRPWWMA